MMDGIKWLAMMAGVMVLVTGSAAVGGESLPNPTSDQFLRVVLKKLDDQRRGLSSHGVMEMTVKTVHWTRTMEIESWTLGEDYSLVKILKPKKEKGTATLKADKTLYTYLSKTGRTIKINSSMMASSWMGSHFTNDDLVQDSRLSEDFTARLVYSGMKDGQKIHSVDLTPKKARAIVYGKIRVRVRADDLLPIAQVFFDERGHAVKKMTFSDYRAVGRQVVPHRLKMVPLDRSGEYTLLVQKKLQFDVKLDKRFFSVHNLKSI